MPDPGPTVLEPSGEFGSRRTPEKYIHMDLSNPPVVHASM